MGIGATLAGGCSIGNGLVETAFSLGKVGYHCPLMILEFWVAAYFTIIRPQRLKLSKHHKGAYMIVKLPTLGLVCPFPSC